jgi:recombinational DNA repair protein RecT
MECVLEPSYVGLVKLLTDSQSVVHIVAHLVYENDKITINQADDRNPVTHYPELVKAKSGKPIGCYALATLHDGRKQVEWMDMESIYVIRGRSETYKAFQEGKIKSCTWVTDEGEMTRKTVIRRIYKYLPRTDRMKFIDQAVQADTVDYEASHDQLNYIDSLLHTSTLDHDQRANIELEMTTMNAKRASEVIDMLRNNQQESDKQRLKRLQTQE